MSDFANRQEAAAAPSPGYARQLGLFSATMLVVGGIIGAGIFLNPAIVAQRVGTGAATMATWGLGALIAIVGALVFAALGARAPRAGGGYVYLRDAFGPFTAFLYGWALFLMVSTGAIAAVAMTFANYTMTVLGVSAAWSTPLAVGAIVLLTAINIAGVAPGAITQNVATVLKLAAIGFLVVAAFIAPDVSSHPGTIVQSPLAVPHGALAWVLAVGTALVPVLFAFGGWQQTNFVAEELRDARRDLPRALILGVLIVVAAYLLVNLAYLRALGVNGLAVSRAPAAETVGALLGERGRALIAAGIAISTFGFLNLVILVTPRVYQAMAADGVFFARMAIVNPRTRTPIAALIGQAAWAIVLLLSGSYGQLLDYVVFADWVFFAATGAALFVYRARETRDAGGGAAAMPTYGHPVTTVLFLAAAVYVIIGSIVSNPPNALKGSILLALGWPAYAWWRRRSSA